MKLLEFFGDYIYFECNENINALDLGQIDDESLLNFNNNETFGRNLQDKYEG